MPLRMKVTVLLALFAVGCASKEIAAPPELEPEPTSLRIGDGLAIGIHLGVQFELPLRLLSDSSEILAIPQGLLVESRNPAIIGVDSGAFITARAMGSAWIVASLVTGARTLADSVEVRVVCTMELRINLTPTERTLIIGESFTPSIKLSTCGGRLQVEDTFRWRANDTTVVRVDSVSGMTTGKRAGTTFVLVKGTRHGNLGIIPVTVNDRSQ